MERSAIKVYDCHLHMGNLSDTDIVQPLTVKRFIQNHDVSGGAIMPTASRGGNDDFNFHIELYKKAVLEGFTPILYITPRFIEEIKNRKNIKLINFLGVKIHPDAVDYSNNSLEIITEFAQDQNLPIFIHTGGKSSCESIRFEFLIKKFTCQTFVLCHARPSDQAFYLLDKYPNVWIDTSFLPFEELQCYINENNENRIMFGTDFPANRWYPDLPCEEKWYELQIVEILRNFPFKTAQGILGTNFIKFRNKYINSLNLS